MKNKHPTILYLHKFDWASKVYIVVKMHKKKTYSISHQNLTYWIYMESTPNKHQSWNQYVANKIFPFIAKCPRIDYDGPFTDPAR